MSAARDPVGGDPVLLPELIERHGRFRAARPAFRDAQRTLSWGELAYRVRVVAHSLQRLGVVKGDRVGMLCSNEVWAYVFMLAVLRVGAVVTPFCSLLTPAMISNLIRNSGIRLLGVSSQMRVLALESVREASDASPITIVGEDDLASAADSINLRSIAIQPEDAFSVIYSSGTTGAPKGIVHSHRARLSMGMDVAQACDFGDNDLALICTPPYTNGTFIFLLPALIRGATIVLMERFDSGNFFQAVEAQRATHAFIVPTLLKALLNDAALEQTDLSSLKTLLCAGAPIAPEDKARALRRFGPALCELWGLTEGLATFIAGDAMTAHPTSVGRPLPSVDLKVVDAQGREICGEVGEIVGRSSFLMDGYVGGGAMAMEWRGGSGLAYLRTGDLGVLDEDGYLSLKGRIKDLIISGGLNVYVSDLEAVLMQHEDIVDAAVVGTPHEKWGETPVAFVRLRTGAGSDAAALLGWANGLLAKHQRFQDLRVLADDFPRNALGKVLREELRTRATARHGRHEVAQ